MTDTQEALLFLTRYEQLLTELAAGGGTTTPARRMLRAGANALGRVRRRYTVTTLGSVTTVESK